MTEPPTRSHADRGSAGAGVMLLSAALFGYFGFATAFNAVSATGQVVFFVVLLEWTLKISAVAFAVSAALTFVSAFAGNLLYAVTGLVGALAFVVVVGLDLADPQHTAMSPLILLLFAAWNGYGSWTGLRALMGGARRPRD